MNFQMDISILSICLCSLVKLTVSQGLFSYLKQNVVFSKDGVFYDGKHLDSLTADQYLRNTGRSKRQVSVTNTGSTLSNSDAQALLDSHNAYRRLQGGSDMKYMVWSNNLAKAAQEWADKCNYYHGGTDTQYYSGTTGQNLYATTGSVTGSMLLGLKLWYDEINYYDYATGDCNGPICGHYTQMVWFDSNEMGCAVREYCEPLKRSGFPTKGGILVCNYAPQGNIGGVKPFKKGNPCTECSTGKYWCQDSLCRDDCAVNSGPCTCNSAPCKNCADLTADCSCACKNGTMGQTCADICRDLDVRCGRLIEGFPASYCTSSNVVTRSYMEVNCQAFCGFCVESATTPTCSTTTPKPVTVPSMTNPCMYACKNGGTGTSSSTGCVCTCTSEWQGNYCQYSITQVASGAGINIAQAQIADWPNIWANIKPIILYNINAYCNKVPGDCCSGANAGSLNNLPYITDSELLVADGYPTQTLATRIYVVIYATPSNNNALCTAAINNGKRRKKRQSTSTASLPQNTLISVINSIQSNISSTMLSCCNVVLDSVGTPASPTTSPNAVDRTPEMIAAMAAISVIMVLVAVVSCVAQTCRGKCASKDGYIADTRESYYKEDLDRYMRKKPTEHRIPYQDIYDDPYYSPRSHGPPQIGTRWERY